MMDTFHWILVAALFLFTVLFHLLLSFLIRKAKFKKRLRNFDLLVKQVNEKEEKGKKHPKSNGMTELIKKAGNSLEGSPKTTKWKKLLIQANSQLSSGEFLLFRLLSMITFALIGYVSGINLLFIIPLGVIGFWLPVLYIKKKIEKRMNRCSYQLAECLGTMANSMRAGFSFMQAMKLISEEFVDPIGPEFEKTIQDINYGIPVEEAFMRLLERLPDQELEMAVKAMLIQRTSGGNLAVLLETIQETVNGRNLIKGEIKTLTAQGKMSSWIITGLPIVLALYFRMANPDYFNLLLDHPVGIILLLFAGIGIIMGWIFIRKIIRIEV